MSQEDPKDFVVANFAALEGQLLEFMEYVPYIERNQSIVSPKLIPILMDACSLIDSIFRHASPGGGRYTLKSFSTLHEGILNLECGTTLFLVYPLQFFRPFQGWTSSAPEWWNAYNSVKHDRIENYSAATYGHVVQAMAALHLLLARSWSYIGNLCRAGWFNESAEVYGELLTCHLVGSGPPDMAAESKLFVSPLRNNFVDDSQSPIKIDAWDFTDRVKTHIWEYEWR